MLTVPTSSPSSTAAFSALLVGPIRADLGISDTQLSLLHGLAFAIFYTLLGIPIASLADRRNRRNLIAVGVTFWSVATAACGLTRSFGQLFLARIGVGDRRSGALSRRLLDDCRQLSAGKARPGP